MTGWTDERVTLLTRLWLDGRSASQIEAELGEGVTRNAVMGKVHRLGLTEKRAGKVAGPKGKSPAPPVAAAPKPAAARPVVAAPVPPKPIARPVPPLPSGSVTILDLRDSMCRWPVGDPGSESFRYCGRRQAKRTPATPYCADHHGLAYQPRAQSAQHRPTTRIKAAA